ncbi:MAG TPA: radical SAM protein, partial [Thermoguttaceae bacterium]
CRPASAVHFTKRPSQALDSELLSLVRIIQEQISIYKLRLTGGEPLLYPQVADLIAQLRQQLPQTKLCITTNGTFLVKKVAELKAAGLDSLNISLDTLNEDIFRELSGGGCLEDTISGISAAREAGFTDLKLNSVLIRGVNTGSLAELVQFAARTDCEIRFIELMPYGQGAALFHTDYLGAEEALNSLKQAFSYVGPAAGSGTASRFQFLVGGRAITVGFITPVSHPFCSVCDRLRLSRSGRLFACLRQQQGIDLLTPLRRGDLTAVREHIKAGICGKHDPGGYWPEHNMVSIGG